MPAIRKVSSRKSSELDSPATPLRRNPRRVSASAGQRVISGRVGRVPRLSSSRPTSLRSDDLPLVPPSTAVDNDYKDMPQLLATIEVESMTNPKMVKVFGKNRSNPFYEALPRPSLYVAHDPAALQIIDGPRATQTANNSINEILANEKPSMVAELYSRTTAALGFGKKVTTRPPLWTTPDVTASEIDKLMKIIRSP
ncbi:hypothetical protein AMS68_003401 [Peltaster fructicola]|uniref:Uncharacterized protein n=1 Tax=Peltaster fructicola TaxID=286661 RepID=A0A6H0XT26_9PEZI|nr:hypothetical protein AMS68_003401 [Peltaster fructicola]